MFHLYFGAFDILLYLGGTYFAMVMANAICDQLEQDEVAQEETATEASTVAPRQSITTTLPTVPVVKKKEEVGVRVSVN
jgi:hypothetical protein